MKDCGERRACPSSTVLLKASAVTSQDTEAAQAWLAAPEDFTDELSPMQQSLEARIEVDDVLRRTFIDDPSRRDLFCPGMQEVRVGSKVVGHICPFSRAVDVLTKMGLMESPDLTQLNTKRMEAIGEQHGG